MHRDYHHIQIKQIWNEMPNSLKKHIKEDLQKKTLRSFIKYIENRTQLKDNDKIMAKLKKYILPVFLSYYLYVSRFFLVEKL